MKVSKRTRQAIPVVPHMSRIVALSTARQVSGAPFPVRHGIRISVPKVTIAACRPAQQVRMKTGLYALDEMEVGVIMALTGGELQVVLMDIIAPEVRALVGQAEASGNIGLLLEATEGDRMVISIRNDELMQVRQACARANATKHAMVPAVMRACLKHLSSRDAIKTIGVPVGVQMRVHWLLTESCADYNEETMP